MKASKSRCNPVLRKNTWRKYWECPNLPSLHSLSPSETPFRSGLRFRNGIFEGKLQWELDKAFVTSKFWIPAFAGMSGLFETRILPKFARRGDFVQRWVIRQ